MKQTYVTLSFSVIGLVVCELLSGYPVLLKNENTETVAQLC